MTKQVLCIRDYIENGKLIWTEGEYYELLETYEDKNIDDCMYQIKTNTGEGNIFGEDFRIHFMPVNDNVEITRYVKTDVFATRCYKNKVYSYTEMERKTRP